MGVVPDRIQQKKMKIWCCNLVFCMLAEGKGFRLAIKNEKNVTCKDGFGEEAALLGA